MVLCVLMERAFRIHLRPFEAAGYFFFRLRKKKQERIFVSGGRFYGVPPWALLLSSPKEVSKKGATVSTRWTPTREQSPLDPAQRETIKCNFYRLLPGPPCGPGVQVLPLG